MKLENSFTVAAPLDETWRTLLDIERVATCLPGAKIEPDGGDGVFKGAMKIKLGPMTVDYRGTARLEDVDEDTHTASIAVSAREAKGQGTAAAVIENHLEADGDRTKVIATTDLKITGRQAQFGRGIMEDVATTMMNEFSSRLEQEIQGGGRPKTPATEPAAAETGKASAAGPSGADDADDEVLDVGNVLAVTPLVRNVGIGAASLAVLLLAFVVLGRSRSQQYTLNVNLRQ